jgi:Arc/MetJ family transcription regulator
MLQRHVPFSEECGQVRKRPPRKRPFPCGCVNTALTFSGIYDMASHMKTTIHIADSLFRDARRLARQERTTLRSLVEEGLRRVVSDRRRRQKKSFRLRKATFKGRGLQPHLAGATWDQILDIGYEGRGG